jgi:hypothetical protein
MAESADIAENVWQKAFGDKEALLKILTIGQNERKYQNL